MTAFLAAGAVLLSAAAWAAGGRLPPNLALKDLDGKSVRVGDLCKDRPALLVFFAACCAPAKRELPDLNEIYREFKDRPVAVIAINVDSTRDLAGVKPFVAARKLEYTVLLDTEAELSRVLNPRGARPFTVILDQQGAVSYEKVGYNPGHLKEFRAELEKVLAPAPAPGS